MKILDDYLQELTFSTIVSGIVLANIAADTYKDYGSKISRTCRNFEGNIKSECKLNLKVQGLKKYLTLLKKAKSNCNKSKNLKKCNDKINNKIKKIQEKIIDLNHDLNKIKRRA